MAAVYRYDFQDLETQQFYHAQGSFDLITASMLVSQQAAQARQSRRTPGDKPGILRFMGCRLVSCDCPVCQQNRTAPLATPRHDGPTKPSATADPDSSDESPREVPLVRGVAATGVIGGFAFLLLIAALAAYGVWSFVAW